MQDFERMGNTLSVQWDSACSCSCYIGESGESLRSKVGADLVADGLIAQLGAQKVGTGPLGSFLPGPFLGLDGVVDRW